MLGDLIDMAGVALYIAKNAGRVSYEVSRTAAVQEKGDDKVYVSIPKDSA